MYDTELCTVSTLTIALFNDRIAEVIHGVGVVKHAADQRISPRTAVEVCTAIPHAYEGIIEGIPPQDHCASEGICWVVTCSTFSGKV